MAVQLGISGAPDPNLVNHTQALQCFIQVSATLRREPSYGSASPEQGGKAYERLGQHEQSSEYLEQASQMYQALQEAENHNYEGEL